MTDFYVPHHCPHCGITQAGKAFRMECSKHGVFYRCPDCGRWFQDEHEDLMRAPALAAGRVAGVTKHD